MKNLFEQLPGHVYSQPCQWILNKGSFVFFSTPSQSELFSDILRFPLLGYVLRGRGSFLRQIFNIWVGGKRPTVIECGMTWNLTENRNNTNLTSYIYPMRRNISTGIEESCTTLVDLQSSLRADFLSASIGVL